MGFLLNDLHIAMYAEIKAYNTRCALKEIDISLRVSPYSFKRGIRSVCADESIMQIPPVCYSLIEWQYLLRQHGRNHIFPKNRILFNRGEMSAFTQESLEGVRDSIIKL